MLLRMRLQPPPPALPPPHLQDLKSLQSIKSKMAGGATRQSMALHAAGGPLGPSLLSRTSTPNVDLIKVWTGGAGLVGCHRWIAKGYLPNLASRHVLQSALV